jgi:hypothetical protein
LVAFAHPTVETKPQGENAARYHRDTDHVHVVRVESVLADLQRVSDQRHRRPNQTQGDADHVVSEPSPHVYFPGFFFAAGSFIARSRSPGTRR